MTTNIFRSDDGAVFGVCKGLSKRLEIDVLVLRVIWLVAFLFAGAGLFMYLILAVSLPLESEKEKAYEPKVLGVCARFAKRAKTEVGIVRTAACILLLCSFGTASLAYFAAHFILPQEHSPTIDGQK